MRTAIITGASAGIGAATARHLVDDGWHVVNLSRRDCPVQGVRQITCDFADPEALRAACREVEAIARSGGPHDEGPTASHARDGDPLLLVHNATLLQNDSVGEVDTDTFMRVLQINLAAPNALNNAVLPHMRSGSAIIYVGSTLSEKAVPDSYTYVTSKHAVVGMMRATCQDLAGRGIHTACVCPGFTDTEMLRSHIGTDQHAEALVTGMSAFGRLITPEEIAETIVWAAGHPVINGAVLHANLGQVER